MKKNNDGFTIVELIVVIAMLVIFIGAVSVNVGRITGRIPALCTRTECRRIASRFNL